MMSLNRNFKIKCRVFWDRDSDGKLGQPSDVAAYINKCVATVEENHDVYDFDVSENRTSQFTYYTVYVKYKEYED